MKVFQFLIAIFLFQFILSCCKEVKYFDFDKMTINLSTSQLAVKDTLIVQISPTSLRFMSSHLSDFGFNSVLAFDCDNGWCGMKFPFEKIEITSDKDFNNTHLSNTLLNDLFKMSLYKGQNKFDLSPIVLSEIKGGELMLVLSERPTIEKKQSFKIKLTKSNKEEIVVETSEISWN